MNSVYGMNDKGIEIKKTCYYSGINRITYYYRKKHENKECVNSELSSCILILTITPLWQ